MSSKKKIRVTSGFRSGAQHCPCCGSGPLDGFTHVAMPGERPRRPQEGDRTMCAYCRRVLVVCAGGRFREATPAEEFELRLRYAEVMSVFDDMPPLPKRP